jgi:hypothetical protein
VEELTGKRTVGANKYRKAYIILDRMKEKWQMSDDIVNEILRELEPSVKDTTWAARTPAKDKADPPKRPSHLPRPACPQADAEVPEAAETPEPLEYSPQSDLNRSDKEADEEMPEASVGAVDKGREIPALLQSCLAPARHKAPMRQR